MESSEKHSTHTHGVPVKGRPQTIRSPEYYAKHRERERNRYYADPKVKSRIYIRAKSPSGKAYHANYLKQRRASDPTFRLRKLVQSNITNSLTRGGVRKRCKTTGILGCGYHALYKWIEGQFLPGMTWDNRGDWHIDHYLPLSLGTTADELEALNHFSNLRPIWKHANHVKSDKRPEGPLPKNLVFVYERQ